MSLVAGTPLVDVYSYWPDTNQLDSVLLSTGVERRFTYDGAGNVIATNRGALAHSYTYDAANRMSSFAVNGVVQAQYQYNSLGQQVVRHLTASGKTIHSVHDALGNRIAEYDYDAGTGTSTLIREYIWAGGMIVGVVEAGQLYFVRTDHIGRPVFATDDAGVKVWEATYLPFGGVHTSSGLNSDLRFPGQWFQSETGLHQNWMRDYDPTTGRYMQADPLGLVDGASIYGYALQNPGRYVDPTGLWGTPGIHPDSSTGSFFGGYGSFWRGIGRCVFGACQDPDGPRKVAELINAVRNNPDYHACLMQLLEQHIPENKARIAGRLLGPVSASAMLNRGRPVRSPTALGQRLTVSQSLAVFSIYGDLVSTINRRGDMDPASAMLIAVTGQADYDLSDVPCECQEILSVWQ